jgi:signal transduction histidine kinase
MRGVVDDAVEAVHPDIARRQQHMRVHLPDRAVWCVGDPARLRQIVVNLLSNSSRFTPSDGQITLSLNSEAETVMLIVADTGEGFEADVRERIFHPFAQETESQGLGLGLAISRAIAELHGGTLVAESGGRGKGSMFVLQLPGVLERTREIRESVSRTREETRKLIERARLLRTAHDQLTAGRNQ